MKDVSVVHSVGAPVNCNQSRTHPPICIMCFEIASEVLACGEYADSTDLERYSWSIPRASMVVNTGLHFNCAGRKAVTFMCASAAKAAVAAA